MNAPTSAPKKDAEPSMPATESPRDKLRATLLGDAALPEFELITIFGGEIELRQPSWGAMMAARAVEDDEQRAIGMVIEYAYVPGTNERVFEEGDKEKILQWPFGSAIMDLQMAIARLTGVDIASIEEELAKDPLRA